MDYLSLLRIEYYTHMIYCRTIKYWPTFEDGVLKGDYFPFQGGTGLSENLYILWKQRVRYHYCSECDLSQLQVFDGVLCALLGCFG